MSSKSVATTTTTTRKLALSLSLKPIWLGLFKNSKKKKTTKNTNKKNAESNLITNPSPVDTECATRITTLATTHRQARMDRSSRHDPLARRDPRARAAETQFGIPRMTTKWKEPLVPWRKNP
jgi:hypothetical protein